MSQEIIIPVIAFGAIAGAATLSGVLLLTRRPEWSKRNSHFINSFAAGVIIALAAGTFVYVSASDSIPELHERNNKLHVLILLGGIVFLYIITMAFG